MTQTSISKNEHCAVILSAGIATRCNAILSSGFKFLLPLPDMPIGFKLISQLHRKGVTTIVLVASKLETQKHFNFLSNFCASIGINLIFAEQNNPVGPGDAFHKALEVLGRYEPSSVTLLLADTYIPEGLPDLNSNAIMVAKKIKRTANWCWAKLEPKDNKIIDFIDKKIPPQDGMDYGAVCGVYNFNSFQDIKDAANKVVCKNSQAEINISPIIMTYMQKHAIHGIDTNSWLDFGNLTSYQDSYRKCFSSNKGINQLFLQENRITKSYLHDDDKAGSELTWFNYVAHTPLQVHTTPVNQNAYTLEHFDSPSLGYIYHFLPLVKQDQTTILEQVLGICEKHLWSIRTTPTDDSIKESACKDMYINKTLERLRSWPLYEEYYKQGNITVNGAYVPSIEEVLGHIQKHAPKLCKTFDWAFIHGDLNFSNIIYKSTNGSIKLIDPRGSFGGLAAKFGGDKKYELAKLRHSYNGGYEMFTAGLYSFRRQTGGSFSLNVPKAGGSTQHLDDIISMYANIEDISFLEAILYMSMVPLHHGQNHRDEALLIRGLELMSKII